MMTRRKALKATVSSAMALSLLPQTSTVLSAQPAATAPAATGPFSLAKLPYAYDALEPHIDARTMEIHHSKHHAAYVTNLNKAVASKPELLGQVGSDQNKALEELIRGLHRWPAEVRTTIRNHGGGTYNHNLFWQMLSKTGGGEPKGEVLGAIDKSFGSFSKFKEEFTKAALGQFGSGWAWLLWNGSKLEVKGMPNQDAPVLPGQTALLGIDVWEHAYYLKYQNRRADYINAFYNLVNWDFVQARLAAAKA